MGIIYGMFAGIMAIAAEFLIIVIITYIVMCLANAKVTEFFAKKRNFDEKQWFWIGFFTFGMSIIAVNCVPDDFKIDIFSQKSKKK